MLRSTILPSLSLSRHHLPLPLQSSSETKVFADNEARVTNASTLKKQESLGAALRLGCDAIQEIIVAYDSLRSPLPNIRLIRWVSGHQDGKTPYAQRS